MEDKRNGGKKRAVKKKTRGESPRMLTKRRQNIGGGGPGVPTNLSRPKAGKGR